MATEKVTPDFEHERAYRTPDRAEIANRLTDANKQAMRIPAHWGDHKRRIHERINDLLDAYEAAR
jgi:hypothetical protein